MLDGLTVIEAAVRNLVTRFDVYSRAEGDSRIGNAVINLPEPEVPAP